MSGDLEILSGSLPSSPRTGFRRSTSSGLIVPEELSRAREVWTRDEWKLFERFTKLAESRGLRLFLGCREESCRKAPIERIRQKDGSILLRCEHKDRVLTKAF